MNRRPAPGVVFDCNILLQAVARKTGPAAACLRFAEEGFVHLHLSEEILIELSDVLKRPTIRASYPELTDEIVEDFLERLRSTAEITRDVPRQFSFLRDIDDEPYLNLAIKVKADYVVSRDKDLLDLMTSHSDECKEFRQRFRSITVIEPVKFLRAIREYQTEGEPD